MGEAMAKVFMFLQENQREILNWDEVTFQSFICMAMEEWCRKNDRDVVELAADIAKVVEAVNEQEGKYA